MRLTTQQFNEFNARLRRERERQQLGSHGAASPVRRIDPATCPVPEIAPETAVPRPAGASRTVALLDAADAMLVRDAKRRHGKRYAKRARNQIVTGRYR
jgi:hypothetical protein